jgi:N-acetylmuramoyl-L-alanine amidase
MIPVNVLDANQHTHRRVIVIDPGHGGDDPGTHGRSGTLEKDVVLEFANKLVKHLLDNGQYDVYMTRNKDFFISLRERVAIARRHKADLFISIHADSIIKSDVRGMSVYTLSEIASDREAEDLASKENLSGIIAGIDFQGKSPEVTDILINLVQRETKNYSVRFAKSVVDHVRQSTRLLEPTHRFAGFVVLKAPDVPSILVELGFLTNGLDEKRLTSSKWQSSISESFVHAVDHYFGDRLAEGPN